MGTTPSSTFRQLAHQRSKKMSKLADLETRANVQNDQYLESLFQCFATLDINTYTAQTVANLALLSKKAKRPYRQQAEILFAIFLKTHTAHTTHKRVGFFKTNNNSQFPPSPQNSLTMFLKG